MCRDIPCLIVFAFLVERVEAKIPKTRMLGESQSTERVQSGDGTLNWTSVVRHTMNFDPQAKEVSGPW